MMIPPLHLFLYPGDRSGSPPAPPGSTAGRDRWLLGSALAVAALAVSAEAAHAGVAAAGVLFWAWGSGRLLPAWTHRGLLPAGPLPHPPHSGFPMEPQALARHSREGDGGPGGPEIRVVRRSGGRKGGARGGSDSRRGSSGPDGGGSDENIARAVWRKMQQDDAFNVAGGMAYFAFLSFPPTILVLFGLTGFFGGEQSAQWLTDQLTAAMPDDAAAWIDTFVDNVVRSEAPGPFSIGLVVALWAASNVFMAVIRALNVAYDVDEPRPWVKQRALALGVMLFFVIFLLVGSAALILGPQIASALNLFGVAVQVWDVVQWILPLLLVIGAFWIAYYVLPARDQKRSNREILIGAVFGAVVWVVASVVFRFYISNFGTYNETYGVLGGIIILLLWLYLTMLVILLGGQLAAELERRARR
jgi:membrane protein